MDNGVHKLLCVSRVSRAPRAKAQCSACFPDLLCRRKSGNTNIMLEMNFLTEKMRKGDRRSLFSNMKAAATLT